MVSSDLDQKLSEYVGEAADLRFGLPEWTPEDPPTALHAQLLLTRQALDRVEWLQARILTIKGRVDQAHADRKAALDDKWNREATSRKIGFQWGDAAPRERYAQYSLKTVNETVELRKIEALSRRVDTALELVRMYRFGLDSNRRDLDTRIRLLSIEGRLES
jgi:hypothetical protein